MAERGDEGRSIMPLDGLTVLDFSQFLAGPSCALRLGDLGARVIKVERPDGGDLCRGLYLADMAFDEDSALFHAINRGKLSVAADLKEPSDLARVKALVGRADVLIHNFRPGIMERLGLGWKDVSAINPRLVYAGVSGYGGEGPWRDRPGQDLLVQSLSGLAWLSGDSGGPPVPAGLAITDMTAGAHLVQGVLALLVRRGINGKGGRVDVSLIETAVDLQFEHLSVYLNRGGVMPERSAVANANLYLAAPYGLYATVDGWLAIAMCPIDTLARTINCPALAAFPRERWFTDRDAIKTILREHLATQPTRHWLDRLEPAGIWAAPVNDWATLLADPAFAALDAVQQVRAPDGATLSLTRCPIRIDGQVLKNDRAGPRLGADAALLEAP